MGKSTLSHTSNLVKPVPPSLSKACAESMYLQKKKKKRRKTELTNYTSITQIDITMKNDESKHTNGTLIKLLLKRTPPPQNKLVSTLHVQPPVDTTCISNGHFPLSLISNVLFSGRCRGGVGGGLVPPLIYRPN